MEWAKTFFIWYHGNVILWWVIMGRLFKGVAGSSSDSGNNEIWPIQISIFTLHYLFEERTSGHLLLKLLRCYIEIDLYAALEWHTEETIAAGQWQIARFCVLLGVGLCLFVLVFGVSCSHNRRHTRNLKILKTQILLQRTGTFQRFIPSYISLMISLPKVLLGTIAPSQMRASMDPSSGTI